MKLNVSVIAAVVLLLGAGAAGWYWYEYGGRAARRARSEDPAERLAAIRELRGNDSALAVETCRRLSRDPDLRVALQAVRALGDAGGPDAAEALAGILGAATRGAVRGEAAAALGLCAGTDPAPLAATLRADPDARARAGAARGLARLRSRAALPALLDALERDDDAGVRRIAILAIQKVLGVRFPYDVSAPPGRRAEQARSIRRLLLREGIFPPGPDASNAPPQCHLCGTLPAGGRGIRSERPARAENGPKPNFFAITTASPTRT